MARELQRANFQKVFSVLPTFFEFFVPRRFLAANRVRRMSAVSVVPGGREKISTMPGAWEPDRPAKWRAVAFKVDKVGCLFMFRLIFLLRLAERRTV